VPLARKDPQVQPVRWALLVHLAQLVLTELPVPLVLKVLQAHLVQLVPLVPMALLVRRALPVL